MAWKADQFRLAGGINEEDPAFTLAPGGLTFARNYECLSGGGYRRIDGYERFDGRPSPSAAEYKALPFWSRVGLPFDVGEPWESPPYWHETHKALTIPFHIGDVVTGDTSGATGTVAAVILEEGTAWAQGSAAGSLILLSVSGSFMVDEEVSAPGGARAAATDTLQSQSVGDSFYEEALQAVRDYRRDAIFAVGDEDATPGEYCVGPVLGGFVLSGDCYAWRNKTLQSGDMLFDQGSCLFKASVSGWQEVALTKYLRFTAGSTEFEEGDVLVGGTSGATAVVRRVSVGSGNWTGPSYAEGRLAIDTIVGTFQDLEDLNVGVDTFAQADGAVEDSVLDEGFQDKMSCLVYNFYGASNLRRAYGCNGADRAWEFDGEVFIFIETGMEADAPTFIEQHRNHLFLSFAGGSLQNSATGLPRVWSPRLGAAEIGIGDDITGMKSNGNDTLAVTGLQSLSLLQGTSDLDWSLKSISTEIGSIGYTIQESGGRTLFLDRAGVNAVVPLAATESQSTSAISRNVRKTVERLASLAVDSIHAIKKNQYRLFFADKSALIATFYGTKLMGWMMCQYRHQFTCSWSGVDGNGIEQMYGGTDSGYVMKLDTGTSFDGESIASVLQLPYNYHKSPDRDKRFHKITLEMDTPRAIDIRVLTDFDYGAGPSGEFDNNTVDVGGHWDVSSWDQFFWDSPSLSSPETNIDGVARNFSATIYHNSVVDDPFIISAAMVQFSMWGIKR